jgi:PAT family beta-lactamase induction signal transducer AmpG
MRQRLPPWAMGFAMTPLGFYYGFISTGLPILLAGRGVSVGAIAEVSATAFSPTFWAFVLCPVLDVRYSKRTYCLVLAVAMALCLGGSTLLLGDLRWLTAVLTIGCVAAVMFGNALGGWLPDVMTEKNYAAVGGTSNIANLGAAGVFGAAAVLMLRVLPAGVAAGLLGAIVLVPVVLLFYIPASLPRPPRPPEAIAIPWPPAWAPARLAEYLRRPESPLRTLSHAIRTAYRSLPAGLRQFLRPVIRFFKELYLVCQTRSCLLGLMCFLSPTACFALTNIFSGMGKDFRTSENWVAAINGPVVAGVCSLGCLVGIWLCKRHLRRTIYVVAGFGGAAAALALIFTPHTAVFYAAGVLTYNLFQGVNYTAFSAFQFEIVGPGNPLAATQMALLAAAANLPISYMTLVDGHYYSTHGLAGIFGADAASSIAMGVILLLVFRRMRFGESRVDGGGGVSGVLRKGRPICP